MADLIKQFVIEAEAVRAGVQVISENEIDATLAKLTNAIDPKSVFDGRENTEIDRNELASKAVGISEMQAAIADTGSLIVDLSKPGHLISLLPRQHIAIVRTENLFATLGDYLASKDAALRYTQITGPSKTADIEKILVYGAHGPVRLDILLVKN